MRPTYNAQVIPQYRITTNDDHVAAKALADAITTSRQGIGAPEQGMYAGRLDTRRLARLAVKQTNVFTRPVGARPNRVRVTILIDASISMKKPTRITKDAFGFETVDRNSPTRYQVAAQVARDLANATDLLDWVTCDMLAFTTGVSEARGSGAAVVFPIWETGEATTEVDTLGEVPMMYTEEGYALAMAHDEMRERLQGDEQGLVIIISDGAPGEGQHVTSVVREMADDNIPVVSIAVVKSAHQPMMYGADNVVDYNGSTVAMGYDMAKVIGGVL